MGPTSINTLVLVKYAAHSVMGVSLRKKDLRCLIPDGLLLEKTSADLMQVYFLLTEFDSRSGCTTCHLESIWRHAQNITIKLNTFSIELTVSTR